MAETETPEQRRLALMIALHRESQAVQASRLAVLVRAQVLVNSGALKGEHVAQVLGCSRPTWYRLVADLGLRELAAECIAEADKALREAGATDETTLDEVRANPDLGLAVGKVGVWPR